MPRRCARAVPAVLLLLGPAIASLAPAASAAPPHAPAGQAPPVVPEPHYGLLATHTRAPWSADRPPLDGDDDHLVVLVHGLDEVGAIFSELATELLIAGFDAALFVYPNDAAIADNAQRLRAALAEAAAAGVEHVTIVGHSMGGLIAYDAVTHPTPTPTPTLAPSGAERPAVRRVVALGTPWQGAILAHLQPISDAREHALRWWESEDMDPARLLGFLEDGRGEAGRDLLPGSECLRRLEGRAWPSDVALTVVYGQLVEPGERPERPPAPAVRPVPGWVPGWLRPAYRWAAESVGDAWDDLSLWSARVLWRATRTLAEHVGDGVVSAASARAAWPAERPGPAAHPTPPTPPTPFPAPRPTSHPAPMVEVVRVRAGHTSILYAPGGGRLAPGTRLVLDRLEADRRAPGVRVAAEPVTPESGIRSGLARKNR